MGVRSLLVPVLLGLVACSSASQPGSQNALPLMNAPRMRAPIQRQKPSNYIKHVVVIIQENRSFENFFAGFPGANAPMYGYSSRGHKVVKVALHQTTFQSNPNLPHDWQAEIGRAHV